MLIYIDLCAGLHAYLGFGAVNYGLHPKCLIQQMIYVCRTSCLHLEPSTSTTYFVLSTRYNVERTPQVGPVADVL